MIDYYMVKSFSSLMRTAWAKISVKRAITNMKVHEYFKWNSSNTYPEDTEDISVQLKQSRNAHHRIDKETEPAYILAD